MSRPETVEVPVALLDKVADYLGKQPYERAFKPTYDALLALIPATEWEPTEEQVRAYVDDLAGLHFEGKIIATVFRDDAARHLKAAARVLGVDQS